MASYSIYDNANFQSFVRQNYPLPFKIGKYNDIKRKAEDQQNFEASRRSKSSTVYTGEYGVKGMDETSQARKRVSSPTRMNKPHPPEIFLVTRLHNLPGHHNCEKDTASETGSGFTLKKQTKALEAGNQNMVQIFCDSNTNLAAQAWMKLASGKDCEAVGKMMKFIAETHHRQRAEVNNRRSHTCQNPMLIRTLKPEFLASANQWLLNAGTEETAAVMRLLRTLSTAPLISTMKEETDCSRVKKGRRSEFVIHPEWRIQS